MFMSFIGISHPVYIFSIEAKQNLSALLSATMDDTRRCKRAWDSKIRM